MSEERPRAWRTEEDTREASREEPKRVVLPESAPADARRVRREG